METLTSLKNPKIQAWRSLKEKKGREEQQAFLVEGVRMVRQRIVGIFFLCVQTESQGEPGEQNEDFFHIFLYLW